MTQPLLSARNVKTEARRLGFTACGLAEAGPVAASAALSYDRYIAAGHQGGMDYLTRHRALRLDPRMLVEGARTVVSVALGYYPAQPLAADGYRLAYYAYGRDYHDVMRSRLQSLFESLRAVCPALGGRVFCDTAPLLERYWAWRAGLGRIGRHTQLIVPGAGSYVFLGELVLTAPADAYDRPLEGDACGDCRRCIDACPGRALSAADGLDARRCLSYLTIEHRGPLPAATRLGRTIYGCDRCQTVCPHNRAVPPTSVAEFHPSEALRSMTVADWQRLTPDQYRTLFRGSAVKRAKYEGLMRNIRAAEASPSADAEGGVSSALFFEK